MSRMLMTRCVRVAARVAALSIVAAAFAAAQSSSPDSTRSPSDSVRRVEGVLVQAIRGGAFAPIAQTTLQRSAISRRNLGQDVPLLLQGATPSLTAHTETGTPWGYSYLRLRGMDQTRINITIDGVPLNDPEDQVLYFANFADLMANVQSVQVQRGIGTSSAGTASFAGSINFETMPVARANAGGDAQLQVGAFGSQRVSASFHSGLTDSRLALYGRAGALRTNGYRRNSGVEGRSAFMGAGWFGDRDIIKLSVLAGLLGDTLSYVGATRDEVARDRRFNPLDPDETDRFTQQMVSLSHSRILGPSSSLSTTVYRNSANGSYDFFALPDRYRYNLQHWWYGVTSAVNTQQGRYRLNAGINANTYERAHRAYLEPSTALYENTGHKDDASTFAKVTIDVAGTQWFVDLQGRWARFSYEPDVAAGITARDQSWAFFNPRVGVSQSLASGMRAFVSWGVSQREPARSDLLAGEDDLNSGNVAALGDLSRVKPESVRDLELGVIMTRPTFDVSANLYNMAFRNDIARIGPPTASGAIPRRNVGSSYRRGIEVDGAFRGIPRLVVSGNATWSANRIREFVDSTGTVDPRIEVVSDIRTYRNTQPLLTPRFVSTHRADWQISNLVSLGVEGRYQSRAYLDNTNLPGRVLPAFHVVDATARWQQGRYEVTLRGANLGDHQGFGSGAVSSDGTVRYFVLPPRSLFVTFGATW